MLLRKTDSIMVKYARTDQSGHFALKTVPKGNFIFMITYPKYADFVDEIQVKDSSDIDMHIISMILRSQLLQSVVVSAQKGAIHLKGDTTEFVADSFKVQQGATVEDLLKKLPGIQVDKNGQITAQGETVRHVLVDGEEFFGDDPTLVTQNLRADMVDKVQVFDKKNEQSAFMGIDDGQKDKTINLKLKDDKKNGYFGKLEGGIGTDGYYNYSAMFNMFKKKKKFATYGIASNTGKVGLNWQENNSYGQSFASNIDFDENSGFSWTGNGDDLDNWGGQYDGHGYPKVLTAGVHYNDKWSDDKNSANGNYKILQLDVDGTTQTNTQYILPDSFYYFNQKQAFHNEIVRNRLNGNYEYQFDSSSTIKLTADAGTDHKTTNKTIDQESLASDSTKVNDSHQTNATDGMTSFVNSNILWRKKLAKKGRTVSVNIREAFKQNDESGYFYADNNFYLSGIPSSQIVDQYKTYHDKNLALDSRITYSEPLSRSSAIVVNYGISIDNSSSNKSSYNKASDGKYTVPDSLFSNDYLYNVFTQKGGLDYHLAKKKLKFNIGSDVGFTNFKQTDVHQQLETRRDFVNWYPRASMNYAFSQQSRLNFWYNGNTTQPTITQIQPIINNQNPLNIVVGNPDLRPQFNNNFSLSYNTFDPISNLYFNIRAGANYTLDAISSKSYTDSLGRNVTQSVNVDGTHSYNTGIYFGFKWKKPGINVNFYPNVRLNQYVNYVNGQLNNTNSSNYSMGMNLGKDAEKKYSFWLSGEATYTQSTSSIQSSINTRYWTYNIQPGFDIYLPLKFQVHSDCDINIRQKTSVFDNNTNVALWNAWIAKKFFKSESLQIRGIVNDLLDMNLGVDRTVNSNMISQNVYSTIQRYFMLSVIWNFNKAGTPAPKND